MFQEPPTIFSSKNNDKNQNRFVHSSGEKDEEKAPNNGCNLQQKNTEKSSFIISFSDSSEAEISETFYYDSSNSNTPCQTPTKKYITFDVISSPSNDRIRTATNADAFELETIVLL